MNVLVIPEDFRKDQYILKPLISALFQAVGRPQTRVRVCQDPLLGSVWEALNWHRIMEILDRYRGMVDLFILCVDRDGNEGRIQQLRKLEENAAKQLPVGRVLLAEQAWQELEVWVLASQPLPQTWQWRQVRTEINPKERYFLPLVTERRLLDDPGGGRKTLGLEAADNYHRICQLCPELADLAARVATYLAG